MGSCHHSNVVAALWVFFCYDAQGPRAIDASPGAALPRRVWLANKTRSRPIWKRTADMLKPLVAGRSTEEFVFLNRHDESLTRFGIYSLVRRDGDQSSRTAAIAAKRMNFRSDEAGIVLFRETRFSRNLL